ncbi:MAG: UDP-N-acetylmuramate--L-alanine ligase [bacterium]
MLNLEEIKKVHMLGIGGSGVSALARIFLAMGKNVSGEDAVQSIITTDLASIGITVNITDGENDELPEVDLVVHSQAVPKNNPQIKKAEKKNIPVLTYPETVGLLTKEKDTICVCGTHGKTTTTSLTAVCLEEAEKSPTIIVGSSLEQLMGNAKLGEGKLLVLEADEYRRAFINYQAQYIIVNNIEFEHPDYYKDLADVKDAFKEFISNLNEGGIVFANSDDDNIVSILQDCEREIITYGFNKKCDVRAINYEIENGNPKFKVKYFDNILGEVKLKIPGKHNVYNALAAIACSYKLGVSFNDIARALEEYSGAWRRFEKKVQCKGISFYDDYAHHPTEIKVTLAACKERFPGRKIIAVFQPHHHSRFTKLYVGFLNAFAKADELLVMDVYDVKGREKSEEENRTSQQFVTEIKKEKVYYTPNHNDVIKKITAIAKTGDVVITLGAGDVNTIARECFNQMNE